MTMTGNPQYLAGAATVGDKPHVCCICGFEWLAIDRQTNKKIIQASKVNKAGPYCSLCHHLEMAERHANARGYAGLHDAVEHFIFYRKTKTKTRA